MKASAGRLARGCLPFQVGRGCKPWIVPDNGWATATPGGKARERRRRPWNGSFSITKSKFLVDGRQFFKHFQAVVLHPLLVFHQILEHDSAVRSNFPVGNLLGGPNDIHNWIAWRLAGLASGYAEHPRWRPKLASGCQAEFVGRLFNDLLSSKTSIRSGDPASDSPVILE